MTYYESAENEIINRKRVITEFNKHSTEDHDRAEFFGMFPEGQDAFDAQEVLRFLGY